MAVFQINAQYILSEIDSFLNVDWRRGYTFGHIVIDDYNLDDESIDFCLSEATRASYLGGQLPGISDPQNISKQGVDGTITQLRDIIKLYDDVEHFLYWLKSIPEATRLEAMELYWGKDN